MVARSTPAFRTATGSVALKPINSTDGDRKVPLMPRVRIVQPERQQIGIARFMRCAHVIGLDSPP